jgi:hypothetical protein
MIYISNKDSMVKIHVEDCLLWSLYMHLAGAPKLLFFTNPAQYDAVSKQINALANVSEGVDPEGPPRCANPTRHGLLWVDPKYLQDHGFDVFWV